MDNHSRKRREQIARNLSEMAVIIYVMLANLDRIALHHHMEDDMRERIADDFLTTARDVLPTVDAPDELLAMVRSVLLDWVIINDLVALMQAAGTTPRRLTTAEEVTDRAAAILALLREVAPALFRRPDEE